MEVKNEFSYCSAKEGTFFFMCCFISVLYVLIIIIIDIYVVNIIQLSSYNIKNIIYLICILKQNDANNM
jgi:hypothetical protein